MRLIFLVFLLFPMVAQAFDVEIQFEANPIEEKIINYEIYKNDVFVVDTTETLITIDADYLDCASVIAVNATGSGLKGAEACLPLPLPSQIQTIIISYKDRNGNPVEIIVELPR